MTRVTRSDETVTIGDLTVGRIGYGAMRLTGPKVWGERQRRSASHRAVDHRRRRRSHLADAG